MPAPPLPPVGNVGIRVRVGTKAFRVGVGNTVSIDVGVICGTILPPIVFPFPFGGGGN